MNRLEQLWDWIPPLFRVLAGAALVVLALAARTWFAVLVGIVGVVLVIAGGAGFAALWRRQRAETDTPAERQRQTDTLEDAEPREHRGSSPDKQPDKQPDEQAEDETRR